MLIFLNGIISAATASSTSSILVSPEEDYSNFHTAPSSLCHSEYEEELFYTPVPSPDLWQSMGDDRVYAAAPPCLVGLPNELLQAIANLFDDPQDILNFKLTCWKFYSICQEKAIWEKHFGAKPPEPLLLPDEVLGRRMIKHIILKQVTLAILTNDRDELPCLLEKYGEHLKLNFLQFIPFDMPEFEYEGACVGRSTGHIFRFLIKKHTKILANYGYRYTAENYERARKHDWPPEFTKAQDDVYMTSIIKMIKDLNRSKLRGVLRNRIDKYYKAGSRAALFFLICGLGEGEFGYQQDIGKAQPFLEEWNKTRRTKTLDVMACIDFLDEYFNELEEEEQRYSDLGEYYDEYDRKWNNHRTTDDSYPAYLKYNPRDWSRTTPNSRTHNASPDWGKVVRGKVDSDLTAYFEHDRQWKCKHCPDYHPDWGRYFYLDKLTARFQREQQPSVEKEEEESKSTLTSDGRSRVKRYDIPSDCGRLSGRNLEGSYRIDIFRDAWGNYFLKRRYGQRPIWQATYLGHSPDGGGYFYINNLIAKFQREQREADLKSLGKHGARDSFHSSNNGSKNAHEFYRAFAVAEREIFKMAREADPEYNARVSMKKRVAEEILRLMATSYQERKSFARIKPEIKKILRDNNCHLFELAGEYPLF